MRNEIVKEARSWIGTKFHPQARIKGVACDCLGLIMGVSERLRIKTKHGVYVHKLDKIDYAVLSYVNDLEQILTEHFYKKDNIEPGDLGLFSIAGYNQHMGIFANLKYASQDHLTLIHADQSRDSVCEHLLDHKWRRRVIGVFGITQESN